MESISLKERSEPVLEVIACSVADAIEAARGGASRLELISHFEIGGLTPSVELVCEILAAVSLPVRVMLRESVGYGVRGETEIERLCLTARELAGLGIDGVVIGFLHESEMDVELTARILSCAPNLRATFHHAFDEARNQWQAIERLKTLPQVDHILTSGGEGELRRQIERLAGYAQAAKPQITILVGGGLDAMKIKAIREAIGIREFHVGRAARVPTTVGGRVQAARVKELVAQMKLSHEQTKVFR